MPIKQFVAGEEALAADVNTYLMNQAVVTFATVAARDAWAAPPDGATCITLDTYTRWVRRAGAWAALNFAAEIDLTATTSFTAIPQTMKHLRLIIRARSSAAAVVTNVGVRINGASTTNYLWALSSAFNNGVVGTTPTAQTFANAGVCPAASGPGSYFGYGDLVIYDYATATYRTINGTASCLVGSNTTDMRVDTIANIYQDATPVTSLSLILAAGAFAAGSRAWLYGIGNS